MNVLEKFALATLLTVLLTADVGLTIGLFTVAFSNSQVAGSLPSRGRFSWLRR
jgi:hypothetical protein